MLDCLIIGHNDGRFSDYVKLVRGMGVGSGAWRDLNLSFLDIDGEPKHAMGVLNHFRGLTGTQALSNLDFMWPAVTYLTTYLRRRGFRTAYVNLFHENAEQVTHTLTSLDVRAVAITTTLYVAPWPIEEIVRCVKAANAETKIVIGGPYIHNCAEVMSSDQFFMLCDQLGADVYVVSAEGEYALAEVLQRLRDGRTLHEVDNIAFRDGARWVRATQSVESNALEENMVDYPLFGREAFSGFATVRTAKSCPFACAFCGFPQRAGKYTYMSVPAVERELLQIADMGVKTLTFIDDTFNVPKPRFKELLRMLIRIKANVKWNSFLRADHVDDECISLMRDSGCEGVFLGVESGSDVMLKAMNKTSRAAHYASVIPKLRSANIVTHCNLIIGFPGETEATVNETMRLIDETTPDFFRAQLWYCDPTTPVWGRRDELEIKGAAFNWSHPTMTARVASELVEETFCHERKSSWLPQQGFELWSVFYLQRKGMSLAEIKKFTNLFNRAVRLKLRGQAFDAMLQNELRAAALVGTNASVA